MPIELKINAETVAEFDGLLARFHPGAGLVRSVQEWGDKTLGTLDAEVSRPLEVAPKAARQGRKSTTVPTAATETAQDQTKTETTAPDAAKDEPEEHPMLVSKTLTDVKALGNKLVSELGAGPVIQCLQERFKVPSFKALDPADYDSAYAALEALK